MKIHHLPNGRIHEGDWLQADLAPGYSLAVVDGPYGMGKGGWDRVKVDDLAAWYTPHIARLSGLMAASATVYLWNTAEGWARLDPVMRAAGWTFCVLVTWDKSMASMAGKIDTLSLRSWPDVTEVCAMYQREAWAPGTCAGQEIAHAAGADQRNTTTRFIREEREAAGLTRKGMAAYFPSASGGLTGCVTNWEEGYGFPTWNVYQRLAEACAKHGGPRERPWLVLEQCWPNGGLRASYDHLRASYDHLRAEYDHLRAEYDHLREEYEASRPVFNCPIGIGNVWNAPMVAGVERLQGVDGKPLHHCQKPLAFAERMIRASSRPGERVLVPFGGTNREAVAIEWMARRDPAEARQYDACELNQDPGRDYIAPVLAQIRGQDHRPGAHRQAPLFGGAA